VIVEIRGAQFANQGAHLMLLGVLERLHARRPDLEVALAPGPNSPYLARALLGAWQKLPLRKGSLDLTRAGYAWPRGVDAALARYGIVTEARVDAVLDISGFAYGDRWGGRPLEAVAAELGRFHRHGKRYLFLPQAFGPFTPSRAASRFGAALRQATLVCARDGESLEHLLALPEARGAAISRWPDLTLGVGGDPAAAVCWHVDASCALIIPNVRMLDSGPQAGAWRRDYLQVLLALAAECRRQGLTPKVVNHAGHEDAALCAALARDAGGLEVIDEPQPRALKGVIGAAGVVISSRYHGCVSALSQGVACLGTSWSHKYGALFADFGLDSWLARPDVPAAVSMLSALLAQGPRLSPASMGRRDELVARVERLWDEVFRVVPVEPPA
jgi:colanic acid/amylovoran biosynthesis protein